MTLTKTASPLTRLPLSAVIKVDIHGISALSTETVLGRSATTRSDPGGQRQEPQPWQAAIKYKLSGAAMSAADRLINPLGFQVIRYRRHAEIPPEPEPNATPAPLMSAVPVYAAQPRHMP